MEDSFHATEAKIATGSYARASTGHCLTSLGLGTGPDWLLLLLDKCSQEQRRSDSAGFMATMVNPQ